MTVINTNVNALLTQSALKKNEQEMTIALERLSSGKRINSAKDDAAGMAIAQRMTSQIRGLDQAVRNAGDGISMVQTADGAVVEISNMLQRMRELAIQALNGSNTNTDISFLNKEFSQLQAEIERVADNTEWNGMSILNGDAGTTAGTGDTVTFHAGANAGQTVTASFGDFETFFDTNTVAAADVDDSADTFTITGHGYHTSDSVIYANGGAADAGGLTGGTTYFVIKVDANTFKLAASEDDANEGTEITLTGTGNDAQTITRVGVYGGNIDSTTIAIDSTASAAEALAALDTAVTGIDEQRAVYGAVMNRLQYTMDNLRNVSMNQQHSRSRIQDADYAKETSELARTQIIQQAATAMLSQANTLQQTVLQLLQN
ncbi:MAG: flagellin [Pseudomonadota bacterium]|nr:flagellin [Pseudomonadota bacterium]